MAQSLSFIRQRFGFIMVGLVLLVCIVLLARQRLFSTNQEQPLTPVEPVSTIPLTPVDPVELQQEWQAAVTSILAEYDRTGDARAAKERMLTVRVPRLGRDVHLALFVAFNALGESRPEGRAKLAAARAAFQSATTSVFVSSTSTTP